MNVKFSILFFLATLLLSFSSKAVSSFKLEETTISSVHHAIKNKQLTCEGLVNAYLERIKRYNLSVQNTSPLNAFTEINRSVLDDARKLDKLYAQTGRLSGSLHCVPVVLKDNIDSFDTTTTSGSLALLGNQPIKDAALVSQLRHAGAIILGKGTMDEFAWGMLGISSRSGKTGNAYDPSKNSGGSSAGSAVAVSANFTLVAIGTDNSGSVRIPAAFNGIVGLRPSTGLISQNGIYPMGALDGVAGPLARTVADLAMILDVIVQTPNVKTYTVYLNKNGLQGKRIGIVHQVGTIDLYQGLSKEAIHTMENAKQRMKDAGAIFVDKINLSEFDNNREFNQAGEIQDIDAYLADFPAVRKNFKAICESDRTRTFGTIKKCLHFISSVPQKFGKKYKQTLKLFEKNKIYVEKIMATNKLDALLIPSGTVTSETAKIYVWQAPIASNAGLPAISINAGYSTVDKTPIGIEFIGKQFSEEKLIEIAYAYEQLSPTRIVPSLPTENLSLVQLSIAELNNLFTLIGNDSYEQVIKKDGLKLLTPELFRKIVAHQIKKVKINAETGGNQ